MGTPEYADTILKSLIAQSGMEVVSVYTQPDKPVGRKRVMTPSAVKVTALEEGICCRQPATLKDDEVAKEIREDSPDFIVVAAYGQILPKKILDIAPCINLHASLLPKYRGASPIQQALLNGDRETGVTAMLMEEGLDSGPVLVWSVTPIGIRDRKNELFDRLGTMAADLTVETLEKYPFLVPLPQCDADATYCKKISRSDGLVSFDMPAIQIYNRFRAYEGWPGIYLESGLKLIDLELEEASEKGGPGKILAVDSDGVTVACREGALKIKRVQPASKRSMDALSYIRGKRLDVEDIFV